MAFGEEPPLWRRFDDYLHGQADRLDVNPAAVDVLIDEFYHHERRLYNRPERTYLRKIILADIGPRGRMQHHFSRILPNDAAMAAGPPFEGKVAPPKDFVSPTLTSTALMVILPWLQDAPPIMQRAITSLIALFANTDISQSAREAAERWLRMIVRQVKTSEAQRDLLRQRVAEAEDASTQREEELTDALGKIDMAVKEGESLVAEKVALIDQLEEQLRRLQAEKQQVDEKLKDRDQRLSALEAQERQRAATPVRRWWSRSR